MGRRRKGLAIHGWLVVDKPLDVTSTDIVSRLRRLTRAARVGHAGTLDPLATGILPIAFGEATKTVPFVQDAAKIYEVTIRWGEARNTDDREGAVTATSDVRPDEDAILAALPGFTGTISQTPPAFSAIKVNGERAYDLARDGEAVELKPRQVQVHDIEFTGAPDADHATLRITSGKGFYVRALARDLAATLGTVGHVASLRRSGVGSLDEDIAVTMDQVEAACEAGAFESLLTGIETALADYPAVPVSPAEAARLRMGQAVVLVDRALLAGLDPLEDTILALDGDTPVAMVSLQAHGPAGQLKPFRVFNLEG